MENGGTVKGGYSCGVPLIQLIKQLLRNATSMTMLRLQNLSTADQKPNLIDFSRDSSASLNLLLKFQRLLILQVFPTTKDYSNGLFLVIIFM